MAFSSYIQITSHFDSIFVVHQDRKGPVFVHPDQPNWNGEFTNNRPCISLRRKQFHIRNSFWQLSYIHPIHLSQFLNSLWQSGGNHMECIHAIIRGGNLCWIPTQKLSIARAAAMDQVIQNYINTKCAIRINKDIVKRPYKYSNYDINEAHKIMSLLDSTKGLDSLSFMISVFDTYLLL